MRVQHARISDPVSVAFCKAVFGNLPWDAPLSALSANAFRSRWNALLGFFHVPYKHTLGGATPGSLRGTGATLFYISTEDLPRLQWRGRWKRLSTLESYIQEVAGAMLLVDLTDSARDAISLFSHAADDFISLYVAQPALWKDVVPAPALLPVRAQRKLLSITGVVIQW